VPGYKVQSNIAGHLNDWIFLPTSKDDSNKPLGVYWSSSLKEEDCRCGRLIILRDNLIRIDAGSRHYTFKIRPVFSNR
jgi:hypothetical protein